MIYFLHESPAECAKLLDDATLSKMISDIAQVLCNVHHCYYQDLLDCKIPGVGFSKKQIHEKFADIPLQNRMPNRDCLYSKWAYECFVNYAYMCRLGLACCEEWQYRFSNSIIITTYKPVGSKFIKSQVVEYDTKHEMRPVIEWAWDNMPNLRNIVNGFNKNTLPAKKGDDLVEYLLLHCNTTPFPLMMLQKYIHTAIIFGASVPKFEHRYIVQSYRNYYCAKLSKDAKWTRREKLKWL